MSSLCLSQAGAADTTDRWHPSSYLLERASAVSLTYSTQGLLVLALRKFSVMPKECVVEAQFSFVWTPAEAEVSCQNALYTSPSESQLSWLFQLFSFSAVLSRVRNVPHV